MLSRYGTDNIIVMLGVAVILIVFAFVVDRVWLSSIMGAAGFLLLLFTLWFFRDPEREVPGEALASPSIVVSPADGTVVEIVTEREERYLKQEVRRISIFLSPLDVHVNRIPVSGVVKYYEYTPGQYLIANHPKSSELNEQTNIGVENSFGRMLFRQIVGVVARRLVCELKEGDTVSVGDRFGMMKFGSRMDILLDPRAEVLVSVGDKVRAAETFIADMKLNQ